MKRVLGLDLGVGSVGWALVEKDERNIPINVNKIGSRTVPLSNDEENNFSKGAAIPTNKDRTIKRTARKCNNRYKLRREQLTNGLRALKMLPDDTVVLPGHMGRTTIGFEKKYNPLSEATVW